jgi:hypothetical protein
MFKVRRALSLSLKVATRLAIEVVMRCIPRNLKSRVLITCERGDGGGAQIHGRLSTFAFCQHFKLRYVNSPIVGAHFSDGPDWDKKWNAMVAFPSPSPAGEGQAPRLEKYFVRNGLGIALFLVRRAYKLSVEPVLLIVESAHDWSDAAPKVLASLNSEFKGTLKAPEGHRVGGIVVHVRGGDDATAGIRKVKSSEIEVLCIALQDKHPNLPLTLYSNAPVQLSGNVASRCQIDLESSPFLAIGHMMHADVLVIAKSSMSYVAGLACNGVVYVPDFLHPRLPSWSRVHELTRTPSARRGKGK